MNRTFLCSAIEGLTSEYGYNFQQGDKSHYPTTVCRYPSAFLMQPEFVSIEGRKHGRITYHISLLLAKQGAKLSPAELNSTLDEMEQEMTNIFINLSKKERIVVIDNLTIAPSKSIIDNHGALNLVAEADVTTIF
jgi:hypothetical protein